MLRVQSQVLVVAESSAGRWNASFFLAPLLGHCGPETGLRYATLLALVVWDAMRSSSRAFAFEEGEAAVEEVGCAFAVDSSLVSRLQPPLFVIKGEFI